MIKLMEILTEGKWKHQKGKYLYTPTGEMTSIPQPNDRDAILVKNREGQWRIKWNMFKDGYPKKGLIAQSNKRDIRFNYINDLVDWLNKERVKYIGID